METDGKRPTDNGSSNQLPLVIQIGFAGARRLWDEPAGPEFDASSFEQSLIESLSRVIDELPRQLGCDGRAFFLCGISQIAIGEDTVFTKACQATKTVQRIFLPQHLDKYLTSIGSSGPDFTDEQQAIAQELLSQPHIIQQRVVSHSPDRHERFRETNVEIVRVSDVLICLVRANQSSRAGGTIELKELARNRNRPVLELAVSVGENGQPV